MNEITEDLINLKTKKDGLETEIEEINEQILTLIKPYWDMLKEGGILTNQIYYPSGYSYTNVLCEKKDDYQGTYSVVGNYKNVKYPFYFFHFRYEYSYYGGYDWGSIDIPARWLDGDPKVLPKRMKKWYGLRKAKKKRLRIEAKQKKKEEKDQEEYIRLKQKYERSPISN